ncbi:MAG TPA: hypothetical protein VF062_15715 [Candidatus Limnocylindrales bacterium]
MTGLRLTARLLLCMALCAALPVIAPASTANAADIATPNGGFESDLSGWAQFAAGGNVATTEQAFAGAKSAKLSDANDLDSTGLESTRLAATAGTRYAAFARVYVTSGRPDLYLRFYDSAGTLVGNQFTGFTGSLGTWTILRITGTAPIGTTRMSAMLYSAKTNIGVAYFDDVILTKAVTGLGTQIENSQINGTTFGIGANQDKIFGIFTGTVDTAANPARFATVDADTEGVVGSSHTLPGAIGGWAATTSTDGSVYLGSYSNGHVYKHTPGSGSVTDLGQAIAGEEFVWCLTSGADGRIYGGTYKGAGYFKYEPANGFSPLGSKPIWPGKQYVRSIAFDDTEDATYLGVGTNAALIRFDRVTGAKHNILPSKYAGISMVGGLQFTGGRLFAVMANGVLSVLNVVEAANGSVTATEEATFASANHLSPAKDGKVYLTRSGRLYGYDIAAHTFTDLNVPVPLSSVTKLGWVRLADQAAFPGDTLVVVGTEQGRTFLFKYNPANGATRLAQVQGTPTQPTSLNAVGTGPDGLIYTGGYLTGGTGVYNPLHGDSNDNQPDTVHYGLSQTDSMTAYNGKLYLGNYSGAKIHEYDPAAPWQMGTNPRQLAGLSGDGQDRPYAIVAGDGRLFVGTVPGYGQYGGALTVFDLAAGTHTVLRNIVADQSVISLAYYNGKVYGGTTTRNGLGVDTAPRASAAKLFVYDPATGAKTEYALPATPRPLSAITALAVIDGRIWGFAEGFLFIFNPATNTFSTNPVEKFSDVSYQFGSWRDAKLITTPRDTGSVYGTIGSYLFKISKSTLAVTKLVTTGADGMALDEYGNLYYYNASTLYRYIP